jgi:acid phosphatase (class A)
MSILLYLFPAPIWMSFGLLVFGQGQAFAQPNVCTDDPTLACCKSREEHSKDERPRPYVTPAEVPLLSVLPPPPNPDATKVELAELGRLRDGSTREEEKKACLDYEETAERFLNASAVDETLRKAVISCGHNSGLFQRIRDTEGAVTDPAKNDKGFKRDRPYNSPYNTYGDLSPVKTIDPKHDSYSYPSGHATYGTLIGLVLADLLPSDVIWRSAIYRRMEDFGYSRLVSRVHYRSDVYAGHVSGELIYKTIRERDEFVRDFKTTKDCLRAALSLSRPGGGP